MADANNISDPSQPGPQLAGAARRWVARGSMVYDTQPGQDSQGDTVGPFASSEEAEVDAHGRECAWLEVVDEAANQGFSWTLAPGGKKFDWHKTAAAPQQKS